MRAAHWDENVIRLDDGEWQIKLGDDENPGTKHKFPLNVKLPELGALMRRWQLQGRPLCLMSRHAPNYGRHGSVVPPTKAKNFMVRMQ
jgi:hypothetical protein